jgi:hypothetical protein
MFCRRYTKFISYFNEIIFMRMSTEYIFLLWITMPRKKFKNINYNRNQ